MKAITHNVHFLNDVKPQCYPWMPLIWFLIPDSCCPSGYFRQAVSLLDCLFITSIFFFLYFICSMYTSGCATFRSIFPACQGATAEGRDACCSLSVLSPTCSATLKLSSGVKNACQCSVRVDLMGASPGLFPCKDRGFPPAHRLLPAGPLWGHLVVG